MKKSKELTGERVMKTRCCLSILAAAAVWSAAQRSEASDGIEWTYEICNGAAMVTGGKFPPNKSEVVVPSFLGGCPVRGVGRMSLSWMSQIYLPPRRSVVGVSVESTADDTLGDVTGAESDLNALKD